MPNKIKCHKEGKQKDLGARNRSKAKADGVSLTEHVIDETLVHVIPSIVSEAQNLELTAIPSREEIKAAVWSLNPSSAPGPDGFTGKRPLSEHLSIPYDGGRITLHEVMNDVQHPIRSLLPSGILQGAALKEMEDRCSARFESKRFSARVVINNIKFMVANSLAKMQFKDEPSSYELQVLNQFGFSPQVSPKCLKLVRWIPPIMGLCLNVDGASKGNPGVCGGGGCIRDVHGSIRVTFAHFYEDGNNMIAEIRAMCDGLKMVDFLGLHLSIVNTDSSALANSFKEGRCPSWRVYRWWWEANARINRSAYTITHVYREANQVADALANYGCLSRENNLFAFSISRQPPRLVPLPATRNDELHHKLILRPPATLTDLTTLALCHVECEEVFSACHDVPEWKGEEEKKHPSNQPSRSERRKSHNGNMRESPKRYERYTTLETHVYEIYWEIQGKNFLPQLKPMKSNPNSGIRRGTTNSIRITTTTPVMANNIRTRSRCSFGRVIWASMWFEGRMLVVILPRRSIIDCATSR
ncbi:hypothetical protein Taro_047525 [Colocasia esculenta]|uniref:RNase H type-1 domain-containing protein n=1 Tax=Colocasia esculenta TaxID=4460 RepID=A0A843X5J0_COLES|nr:hypothetical protein [Colocasia esculenta]